MKKALILLSLVWSAVANAQFTPGQLLTAQELNSQFALYAPLGGATFTGSVVIPTLTVNTTFTMPASTVLPNGVTATEQGFLDNSNLVATNNFAKRSILAASATLPININSGGQGTYNFATIGSGAQIVVFVSGGSISSVLTIAVGGSGYQVGDCLIMVGGNGDAILRVTAVSSGAVTSASVVYGGTGYTTGAQLSGMALPPGSRTGAITGALTSNLTIIIPSGTYLQGGRRIGFQNNTTGAFTTTVLLSNGAGGSTGTGTVLAQGSNNSTSTILYTDGQNDVWPEVNSLPTQGTLPVSQGGTGLTTLTQYNTLVGNGTSAVSLIGPAVSGTLYASNGASAYPSFQTLSALGIAPIASPTFTGTPAAPTASATTNTTQLATTAMVNSAITGNNLAGSFTTLTASSTITPSQTSGIVGTTTNNNANAGSVGEFLPNTTLTTSASNNTALNATSVSLTAGDWDVQCTVQTVPAGSTTTSYLDVGVSTTSATFTTISGTFLNFAAYPSAAAGVQVNGISPTQRISIASTTTTYCVAQVGFATSTLTVDGFIRARRIR